MEWKKDNTDSEKLKQMEKEYIEAALRMMKKAGISEIGATIPPTEDKEEISNNTTEELHNEAEEITEEKAVANEETDETSNEEDMSEESYETISDTENDTEALPDDESITSEISNADENTEEHREAEEAENENQKGEYGVYTADEILNGEGIIDAERIIEEIKMQNETMKKLTEEQEKATRQTRTCPKCGKIIDGPA